MNEAFGDAAMDVTPSGKTNFVNFPQFSNARFPMLVRFDGNVGFGRFVQPEKALAPIETKMSHRQRGKIYASPKNPNPRSLRRLQLRDALEVRASREDAAALF
jgi:hypothetical protein